jgi:hypothetical protein
MALAALTVAIISLLVATFSVGWQVMSWRLDGGRVRARLVHAAGTGRGIAVGAVGRNSRPLDFSSVVGVGDINHQLLGIEVTNVGRLRVRVTGYSVDLLPKGMALRPFDEVNGPPLPHWLEPGEAETWYVELADAIRLVDSMRAIGKRAHGVRMTVSLGTGKSIATRFHMDW